MIKVSGALLESYDSNSSIAKDLNSVLNKLSRKDSTLWIESARDEAAIRLNWIDLPTSSQALLPELLELQKWTQEKKLTNFILCGMGGSSLAPEVLAKTFSKQLTILDTTDPNQIVHSTPSSLQNTLVIVGSKSGSTLETSSQKLYVENLFQEKGLDPKEHLVIITDPGSPFDKTSRQAGFKVINADPNVGGRFSALSAFGLVPAALMGIDVAKLLNEAKETATSFTQENSDVVKVATLLAEQTKQIFAVTDSDSNVPGLSDWIEQLVAESTGKTGKGRLPVVIENSGSEIYGNAPLISFNDSSGDLRVTGELAEHFIFWEWVTALLCRAIEVDPFNQPNVAEAKERASQILSGEAKVNEALTFESENLRVFGENSSSSLDEALLKFFAPTSTYVAVMAYLDRTYDSNILELRELLADKVKRPVTFGWAPRFLHSTGQFHKGGQPNGAFLQITGSVAIDLKIPERDYSFGKLIASQAAGDALALTSRNLPMMHIHLKDRAKGITELLEAVKKL